MLDNILKIIKQPRIDLIKDHGNNSWNPYSKSKGIINGRNNHKNNKT